MSKYLRRAEAAEYIQSKGLPCTKATLNKLACVGGGPEMRHFGRFPVYEETALDAWIASKLTVPRRSTSEAA